MNSFQQKYIQKQSENRIITSEKISFRVIEAYKIARTNIMFTLAGVEGCKKIVFTSALAGEGKTTSCINLAATFAQTSAKVLVIDADLRRPKIHQYIGEKCEDGLADLLAGFVDINDVVRYSETMHFDYISAGHIPPNPAELLATPKISTIFEKLSQVYDYIFIDSPPVNVVTDASVLAKHTSGMIFVIKQKETPHDALKRAMANLKFADVKLLGFLMNEAETKYYTYRNKYGYRRKYSYDYAYSYNASRKKSKKEITEKSDEEK